MNYDLGGESIEGFGGLDLNGATKMAFKETFMPYWAPMSINMGHGMDAFSKTSIECMIGYIDMPEPHFHIKKSLLAHCAH